MYAVWVTRSTLQYYGNVLEALITTVEEHFIAFHSSITTTVFKVATSDACHALTSAAARRLDSP